MTYSYVHPRGGEWMVVVVCESRGWRSSWRSSWRTSWSIGLVFARYLVQIFLLNPDQSSLKMLSRLQKDKRNVFQCVRPQHESRIKLQALENEMSELEKAILWRLRQESSPLMRGKDGWKY